MIYFYFRKKQDLLLYNNLYPNYIDYIYLCDCVYVG